MLHIQSPMGEKKNITVSQSGGKTFGYITPTLVDHGDVGFGDSARQDRLERRVLREEERNRTPERPFKD